MNKTYKTNKNHPELKEGLLFRYMDCGSVSHWGYTTEDGRKETMWDSYSPENKPEWYDEVEEEKITYGKNTSKSVRCDD